MNRFVRLALLGLVVGCSSPLSAAPPPVLTSDRPMVALNSADVDVEVRSSAPVHVGQNTFIVTFPVETAELMAASALMPAHGHGSPAPAIERDGDAFVIENIALFMSGRWELRLSVRVGDRTEEITVGVDVP